jgi:primosomal protein N' (replication factor Y)
MYLQIAVNIPTLSGVFDYHVPEELEGQIQPGCLVVVPFGKQVVQGVVLRQVEVPQVQQTRPVASLLDPQPVLTPAMLQLAGELSESTLSPLALCIDLMLPPGLSQQADTLYHATGFSGASPIPLTPLQKKILALIEQRGDLRGRQLEAAFPHQNWKESTQALVHKGWLVSRPVLPPPSVQAKFVRTVQLSLPPAPAELRIAEISQASTLARRTAILRFLEREPWPVAVSWAFAASGGNMADLQRLAEAGVVVLGESEIWRDPLENIPVEQQAAPPLTTEQAAVWEVLAGNIQSLARREPVTPVLLHGVTSSGKTEMYLRAVEETLKAGRQAIILVPEISLTPQTVRRFMARFPGQVGLVHSRLSTGERYDTWRRARNGDLSVIVGPRSALFTPLANVGLIVVDECHDESYYQDDISPVYHAVQAALAYARLTNSMVVFGSATPDTSLMYRALQEHWQVLSLPERIYAHRAAMEAHLLQLGVAVPPMPGEGMTAALPMPEVHLVDMRNELKEGNRTIFSRTLQNELGKTLAANQQAILFLNRRGSSTYIFCRDCGYVLRCPRCDFPLTFHTDESALICHICNYRRQLPKKCPQCGSSAIRQYGTGTEKVEADLLELFPGARTLRYDYETTRQKGAHDLLLSHFHNHHADVLIGTQMLAKGLDLPLVTLVGIILADVGLSLPDYRAGERSFQVLTQVAGRAGRSPLGGRVVLQTFQPDHYAIQAAASHDYAGFYRQELAYRRRLGYPPFSHLARLEFRSLKSDEAEAAAQAMASQVQHWIEQGGFTATDIIGPVPCFFTRLAGYYRWQIIVRGPNVAAVLRGKPLAEWRVAIDPPSLL